MLRSALRRRSTRVFAIRAVSLLALQHPHTDSSGIQTGDLSAYVPMLHIADGQDSLYESGPIEDLHGPKSPEMNTKSYLVPHEEAEEVKMQ